MSSKIPAFPLVDPMTGNIYSSGMTLRDWFAGMVLSGIVGHECGFAVRAQFAYDQADAMLLARDLATVEAQQISAGVKQ